MPDSVQISCIRKTNRFDPHDRISLVGGLNANGTRWTLTVQEAIDGIDQGKWQFYVNVGGQRVSVIVARSASGHRYLRTVSDGEQPNNLLSLPECP
jgi:Protein of unknown function (DUF3892)